MESDDKSEVPEDLFKDVTFYIVGDISENVIDILSKYGGKRDTYLSEMVSHVIADDIENHEYQEARELFELPCVMSEWVLLSVKCKKMLDKDLFAPEGRVFSGVVACPSQLEESDWLSLWGMIVYNGGRCGGNLTEKCTHLITAKLEGPKYEEAMKHEDSVKVVTPDWVSDCLDKGEKQDENLYHPRLVVCPKPPSPPKPESPPKQEPMETTPVVSQETQRLQVPPTVVERRSPTESGHTGSRPGTPGSASTKEALAKLVNNRMQDPPGPRQQQAHSTYMGQYPTIPAHQAGYRPGLHPPRPPQAHGFPMHMGGPGQPHFPGQGHPQIHPAHQQMPQGHPQGQGHPMQHPQGQPQLPQGHPQNRPGHPQHPPGQGHPQHPQGFPQPPQAHHHPQGPQQPPGPRGHTGIPQAHSVPSHHPQQQQQQQQQQQTKLRNITNSIDVHKQQGKQSQQQKVAGQLQRPPPPQYFQQPPWPQYWGHDPSDNIPADMCLLGCIFYINDYPKTLDVEQISVWKKVIEQHGGQVDPSYSNRVTHVICANQKSDVFNLALRDQRRLVTPFWLNDVLVKKKMLPPWQALHLPLLYSEEGQRPCSNQIISITNFDGDDRDRVKQMITALGAKYTGYMTRSNSVLVCRRPEGQKYQKAKEWQVAVVNVQWLSDLILGHMEALKTPIQKCYLQVGQMDEFQMDMSKVQHLMVAWRTPLKVPKEVMKKLPAMRKMLAGQENVPLNTPPPSKKQKLDSENKLDLSQPGPRVLFTGFQKGFCKQLQMMVTSLGGTVVENPQHCTHLVAQSFSRTMKFFIGINACHHIVNKQWIEDSYQQHTFLNETTYTLHDPAGEAEMKCVLMESLKRARTRSLFTGMTFYVTPSVQPPVCDLRKVIESAGGTLLKRGLPTKAIDTLKDEQGKPTYVVITCADDIHLVEDVINNNIKVYTAEFVLTGVMRQEKDFGQFQISVER
ncbi:PAX-interacting protein 1-like [Mercenaria mercenaria]|uniref:PAX-interacting protein 1-like n=1 Tax=Mercenaria mercenaria TaxID=6596 RepID=UPI00234F4D8B|nr:PAX-interacting protein 1-like [Mercenaria mercenaria]